MTADPISLGGWDLAFAMSYTNVNAQIVAQIQKLQSQTPNPYPPTISLSQTAPTSPPITITVTGNAGPWQLVPGGSQSSVMLGIQISSATLSNGSASYTGTVAITISGQLQVSASNVISIAKPAGGGSPYSIDYSALDQPPTSLEQTEFNLVLHGWLDTLWPLFGKVMMTIDPETEYPTGWDWLAPGASQAIVLETPGGTSDQNEFIIVSMSGTNTAPSAVAIAGSLIPAGSAMGFAVAPGPFLDNVIKTGMDKTFLKTPGDQFTLAGQKLTANHAITVDQFQIDDTHSATATFTSVELSIEGQQLVFRAHISFPYQESSVQAVVVDLDLMLDYTLSLTRGPITTANNQTIPDFPLIDCVSSNYEISNLTVQASADFQLAEWLASFGATLLVTIAAIGIGAYKGRAEFLEAQARARAGNQAMALQQPVAGQAGAANQGAAAAQQAAGAAGGAQNLPVMWGALPRSSVLEFIGLAIGWLVSGALTMIPVWIVLVQTRHATDLINGNLDDAVKTLLSTYKLPDAAGEDMKVASIGLNNCLLIGANPLP